MCPADRLRFDSGHGILSCAVSGNGNVGRPGVLGVGPDRFDHQVKFIGAIDFARHAIGLARHEVVGLGEVMQAINTLGVAVNEQQHRTGGANEYALNGDEKLRTHFCSSGYLN